MEEFMTGQPPLDAEAGYLTSQLAAGEKPRIGVTLSTLTDHLSRPLCACHPVVGAALSREVRALPVDWSHPGSQLELHLSLLHLAAGRPGGRLRHR